MSSIFQPSNANAYSSTALPPSPKERDYFSNLGIRADTNEIYAKTADAARGYANEFAQRAANTTDIIENSKADTEKEIIFEDFKKNTPGKSVDEVTELAEKLKKVNEKFELGESERALNSNRSFISRGATALATQVRNNAGHAAELLTNETISWLKLAQSEAEIIEALKYNAAAIDNIAPDKAWGQEAIYKSQTAAIIELSKQVSVADLNTPEGKALMDNFIKNKDVLRKLLPEGMKDEFDKIVKAGMEDVKGDDAYKTLLKEATEDQSVILGKITAPELLLQKLSDVAKVSKDFGLTVEKVNQLVSIASNMAHVQERKDISVAAKQSALMAQKLANNSLTEKGIEVAATEITDPRIRDLWRENQYANLLRQRQYLRQEEKDRIYRLELKQHNAEIALSANQTALEKTKLDDMKDKGEISIDGYRRLKIQQEKGSHDMVERVIAEINKPYGSFEQILKKQGIKTDAEILAHQMAYTKVVRDYANNYIGDKDFVKKFSEFMNGIYEPAVSRSLDNLWGLTADKVEESEKKYRRLEAIANKKGTPAKSNKPIDVKTITEEEIENTAKRKGLTKEEVKQRLGIK